MTYIPFQVRNQRVNVKVTETDTEYLFQFPYNPLLLKEIKNMGGARWHPETKHWSADKNSLRTQFILGMITKDLGHSFIRRYYDEVPQVTLPDLYPHQNQMASHLIHRHRSFWAADMGVGKTLAWLRTIQYLYDQIDGYIWVIAPLAPLRAWQYELMKWDVKLPITFLSCDQSRIQKAMEASPEPPQVLCVDEISRFKNPSAKRTQLLFELSRLMYEFYKGDELVSGLTGTPSPKNPADWWAEIEIVCPGFIQENSPKRLVDRLAETEQLDGMYGGTFKKVKAWKPDEINKFYKRIQPITVIVRKKDCLSLPEKVYHKYTCQVSEDILSAARLIIETENHTLTIINKLRQLSDGFQYQDPEVKDNFEWTPTAKDEVFLDLLEEIQENYNRVVIYAAFTASVTKCVQMATENGWAVIRVDRGTWTSYSAKGSDFKPNPNQKQFQDDNLDIPIAFIATADSGGMGITLNQSQHIIYYSNSYNGESRMQSEDRIHRIGSKGANIVDLIHLPTDEKILQKLIQKKNLQEMTLGEMKKEFEESLNA